MTCYSTIEALELHETIKSSETIEGAIEPLWPTDVVCGFVEETRVICWQYSPPMEAFVRVELFQVLGDAETRTISIPADCRDGFLGAYWKRPYAYLDANIRKAISVFFKLRHLEEGLRRLRDDLETGLWLEKYGELMEMNELDVGYRLIRTGRLA